MVSKDLYADRPDLVESASKVLNKAKNFRNRIFLENLREHKGGPVIKAKLVEYDYEKDYKTIKQASYLKKRHHSVMAMPHPPDRKDDLLLRHGMLDRPALAAEKLRKEDPGAAAQLKRELQVLDATYKQKIQEDEQYLTDNLKSTMSQKYKAEIKNEDYQIFTEERTLEY